MKTFFWMVTLLKHLDSDRGDLTVFLVDFLDFMDFVETFLFIVFMLFERPLEAPGGNFLADLEFLDLDLDS